MTHRELQAWSSYFSIPRGDELTNLYIAQLTTIVSNMMGGKNSIDDFILRFGESHKPKKSRAEQRAETKAKLRKQLKNMR